MRTSGGRTALWRWNRCAACAACTWSRCRAAFIPPPPCQARPSGAWPTPEAEGGDVVMLDPATGEVLAIASRRRPSAFTDTFEPGSLAKIFAAASLLSHKRVSLTERMSGEGGGYRLRDRRVTDEDPQPSLTLGDAIRVSSNIAMVKFAARLTPAEQYATLRDFGLGAPTGIEFPAEAVGRLRPPSEWTRPSAASLAMGYELSVTPIQMAVA